MRAAAQLEDSRQPLGHLRGVDVTVIDVDHAIAVEKQRRPRRRPACAAVAGQGIEIATNPALRAQVHPGDTVMHYLNRDPEGIELDGREGFVVVRAKRCVARVVLSVS